MAEPQLPKLVVPVRFRLPAPKIDKARKILVDFHFYALAYLMCDTMVKPSTGSHSASMWRLAHLLFFHAKTKKLPERCSRRFLELMAGLEPATC